MRVPTIAAVAVLCSLAACSSMSDGARGDGAISGSSTSSMSEARVRQDLSDHGYTNVSDLHRSGDGWAGSAVDSTGKSVNVDVDHLGAILVLPP